jgi:hypothetical protein
VPEVLVLVSQPLAQLVTRPRRTSRRGLRAMLGAVALLMLIAAPVLAAMGPTKLEQPSITPTVGTPATTIVAEVTYRNQRDRAPEYVRVVVGGSVHDMTASEPLDWRAGVRFRWSGTLPVGTYEISFEARDWEKFVDLLVAGTVTIEPPPPAPTPTPPPAPDPDPAPGPSDDPAPASPRAWIELHGRGRRSRRLERRVARRRRGHGRRWQRIRRFRRFRRFRHLGSG